MFENQTFLLSDLDSETASTPDSGSMRFLNAFRTNRVRSKIKCTMETAIQREVAESVEKNLCRRINLGQACRDGQKDVVRRLLRNNLSTLNNLDLDGLSPLHYAAISNHVDIVRMLLDAGADVNVRGSKAIQRISPIICAAKFNSLDASRVLLRQGADVTVKNCYGQTALHVAARRGHSKMVELLLSEGKMDVNVVDNDNTTVLHVATLMGCNSIVSTLLYHGANITATDNDGFTAFHLAAREGEGEVLNTLIRTASNMSMDTASLLDTCDHYGNTSIHLAVKHGRCNTAKICLDGGASCTVWQANLQTPLHLAAISGNLCIVKMLMNKGADLDAEDGDGQTAILRASLEGHMDIVEYLLDQGAPLICPQGKGKPTALLCAVQRSRHKTVEFLFKKGSPIDYRDVHWRTGLHVASACADPRTIGIVLEYGGRSIINAKDCYGKTPIHYAAVRCQYVCKIIELLVNAGADLMARDNDERLPLHYAAEKGMITSLKALLQANPESINETDHRSLTALHIAAAAGKTDACRLLLEHGAEVDYRDDHRMTPLFQVVSTGCPNTTRVLLDYGADVDARNKCKKTPLLQAAELGRLAVFRVLLEVSADITAVCDNGWNVLDYALDSDRMEIAYEIIQHERWKELMMANKYDQVTAMKRLIIKTPCLAKVAMDKCIEQSSWIDSDKDYSVTYDFQLLCPPPDQERDSDGVRYFGPRLMLLHGREDLLRHPLTKKLMAVKWRKVGVNFFYLGALIYSLFVLDFSHYMYCLNAAQVNSSNKHTIKTYQLCGKVDKFYYQAISLAAFSIINLLYELYQLYTERENYFEMANMFQVCTFVCALVAVFPLERDKVELSDVKWGAGSIGVITSYLTLLLYLQCLFSTGIYVTMLFEVLKTLIKVFAMFSVLIFGFGLMFILLMNGMPPFDDIYTSLFKVLAMEIGEIEYSRYFVDAGSPWHDGNDHAVNKEFLSRVLFIVFCVLVPIALMNLLIGLAVGDIESVQQHAELKMMTTEIDTVFEFEDKIPLVVRRRLYKPSMTVYPNRSGRHVIALQKYFGWMSGRSQRFLKKKKKESEEETTSSQLYAVQQTLLQHGFNIRDIGNELRTQRELLEGLAKIIRARAATDTNNYTPEQEDEKDTLQDNILMQL